MPQYIWIPAVCLDAPCMFGWPPYVWTPPHMLGCPLYVWISPYAWTPPYIWMPPVCLDDVWMPPVHTQHKESMLCQTKGVSICPIHLYAPICLDALWYVWMPSGMFGCPLHAWIPPYVWMYPLYVWMYPVYVWMPTICLDTPICLDGYLYVWMHSICLHAPCMF